jgi:hypothetical protein
MPEVFTAQGYRDKEQIKYGLVDHRKNFFIPSEMKVGSFEKKNNFTWLIYNQNFPGC